MRLVLPVRLASVLALAACGSSTPAPTGTLPVVTTPPVDAPEASEEERLAAIQKAMNELDEAAQTCWAAVATERFDIEGDIAVFVDIGQGTADASIATDTTRSDKLGACLVALLSNYRWAPPLYGQAIQLPFKFRAPTDGQNVIDRRLVPANGQGKVSVAVLLDDANSGNDAASMFELAIQNGGTTDMRIADRTELWYLLAPARMKSPGGRFTDLAAGDMFYVPKGAGRELLATSGDVHAVVVVVPGGKEGSARAGALPTPLDQRGSAPGPKPLPASAAKTYGPATIYAEPATITDKALAASVLTLPKGASVAEHVHANETEMLYIIEGAGTMTVNGVQLAVTPTSVVQVPPNTKHTFTASAYVRAVQIYTPAGPEQRFKAVKP
ncbi:MAG: cupin domain-containing protein [Kofleriaceae bacterium]|nr:cupin domain-containing protein [Kofleriaceae bacterium]